MAFNTNTGKQSFTATASQTDFDFNFKIFNETDLNVYQTLAGADPDDSADILTYGSDYTVSIDGDAGGTVTLTSGATSGDTVVIERDLPIDRETSYVTNGDLLADTINEDQDYQTYLILDNHVRSGRAILLPTTDIDVDNNLPTTEAGSYLKTNATGTGFVYSDEKYAELTDAVVCSTITEMLALDVSATTTAIVKGYTTEDDGGGGIFNYDATLSGTNNEGTIISGWVRQYVGGVNVEWFGAVGDGVTDDTASIQKAIDASTVVAFGKKTYALTGNLDVETSNTLLIGEGGAGLYDTSLEFSSGGIVATKPQLAIKNMLISGSSDTTEKGSDTAQIGLKCSAAADSDNLDFTITNCTFAYFNKCIEVNGRNIRIRDSLFSNSHFGVYIPNGSLTDIRGLEFYNNRLHSMTKVGESASCIHIEPASNFTDVVIQSCYADDCGRIFTGFASNTTIDGVFCTKGTDGCISADSTASGTTSSKRTFNISNVSFTGLTTTIATSAIYLNGAMMGKVSNVTISEHGGNGIEIESADTSISNCRVTNVGQAVTNTYYGIHATGARCEMIGNIVAQDVPYVATNKMKAGFYVSGPYSSFSGNFTPNMTVSFENDLTANLLGSTPVSIARREEDRSAVPTTGAWLRGDRVWNLSVSAGGTVGWVCVTSGSPGTWKAFGTVAT